MSDLDKVCTPRPVPPAPVVRSGGGLPEPRAEGHRHSAERRQALRDTTDGRHRDGGEACLAASGPDEPFIAAVSGQGGQGGSAGQGEGGGSDAQGGASQADPGEAAGTAIDLLDPRLSHVSDALALVCRYESAQCVWSARIPLDAELLPDTVLHLAYSSTLLVLRFETSDWDVRGLLQAQLPALRAQVTCWLHTGADVVITL